MFCENCGSQMADGSKFCIACGAKAESKEGVLDGASQEVAASVDSSAAVVQEDTSVAVSTAAVPHEAAFKRGKHCFSEASCDFCTAGCTTNSTTTVCTACSDSACISTAATRSAPAFQCS